MTKKILISLAAAGLLAACDGDDETTQQNPLTCENYCTTIDAACTGTTNDQYNYLGLTDCLSYCNQITWDPGSTATTGNTLGCRVQHAINAQTDPAIHCPHAGPTGGGVCGNYCESYCELALEACTGANQIFASLGECQTACAGFTVGADGNVGRSGGNTVQCRIWHLANARVANPGTHCPHGEPISTTSTGGVGPCT